ncbi:MAG TPA: 23S rRNA (adenine(2503)-C(2))-methyltransferase RlmN [Terriglobales bacterium]|nr:23S rRNA (adenine(2503)-C(2))-methyltransferase RlmN [Terriglobales bacterium]
MRQQLKCALLGLSFQELTRIMEGFSQPSYRARQLYQAIYSQRMGELQAISTLPVDFRDQLTREGYSVGLPEIQKKFSSKDGTIRYLMAFPDGQSVETVWMPEGDGGEAGDGSEADLEISESLAPDQADKDWREGKFNRATICISSQAGCAVNCQFCMTALLGLQRNLTAGEIVGQVLAVLNDRGVSIDRERINLVFMGQGEPFLNYENFMQAVRLLSDPEGIGIPASRMTVSTAGIVPRIHDFGEEPLRPKLAISLNASNDAARTSIMPINKKWDLHQLLAAAREFPLRNRERLTFEYVLLDGVNDGEQQAHELVELVRGMRAKINLIALNPGPDIHFSTPAEQRVLAFQKILRDAGIPAYIRRPRGRDIYAACGQLKRTVA